MNLLFPFTASLLATLIIPIFTPSLRLFFFAPFLVIFVYKNKLSSSLWMAFFSGLFLDLLTTGNRLGLLTLNITLATLLLCQLKPYFFEDRLSTIPLMTFFFGAGAACLKLCLDAIFQFPPPFSGNFLSFSWALSDLVVMPACDALCALFFSLFWNALRSFPAIFLRNYDKTTG